MNTVKPQSHRALNSFLFTIFTLFLALSFTLSHSRINTSAQTYINRNMCRWVCLSHLDVCVLTVWQKTMSRRYCSDTSMAIVGAVSCMSRKTIDFLALSLIMATQSVSVVRRGYSASLHSPATSANKPWETKHKYAFKPIISTPSSKDCVFQSPLLVKFDRNRKKRQEGQWGKEKHTHTEIF